MADILRRPVVQTCLDLSAHRQGEARCCPCCGRAVSRPCNGAAPIEPARSSEALQRLIPKLHGLTHVIEEMSESQWAKWVDALEFDEFLEFLALDEARFGAVMDPREARCQ